MDVDTIVSLSTPPGIGALSVVRLSGPAASKMLASLLGPGATLPPVRRATRVSLHDPHSGERIEEAVAVRYEAPSSFTGEDMVELSCHGGFLVPGLVLDALEQSGARSAEAGEFTRRAYLHGKLDLIQAEAIADVIHARSRAFHRAALAHTERGLSRRIAALRERLIRLEALLAHHVDFPEEDEAPVAIEVVIEESSRFIAEAEEMLATAPEGELLREGALAVFAGRPNAGKSSLYNALIGEARAIVTEEPGTTRDALEADVQIGGFPFRLVDTAGLRAPEGRIEALGIEIAHGYLDRADVILYCLPVGEPTSDEDRDFLERASSTPVVLLRTKGDMMKEGAPPEASSEPKVDATVTVSAENGTGLDELRRVLPPLVFQTIAVAPPEMPVLTRARHSRALRIATSEVEQFRDGLANGLPAEVASTHLRSAETALEELLGTVSIDDVLDVVFREFCIGK